jgi:phosphatidylglycerophosphate synthase
MNWKTKTTDRFILRFIKVYISAPISLQLVHILPDIRPIFLTFLAACLGIFAGIVYGFGFAWIGALLAAFAQILDGVDGQVARLTNTVSRSGAFLDSVLDRYVDFSLLFGVLFHCLRCSSGIGWGQFALSPGLLIAIAGLAAVGSSQVSYTTARAASLNLRFSRPEHAGKGSRTAAIIICGFLTPFWIHFPLAALIYLAIHPNFAVIRSIIKLSNQQLNKTNA